MSRSSALAAALAASLAGAALAQDPPPLPDADAPQESGPAPSALDAATRTTDVKATDPDAADAQPPVPDNPYPPSPVGPWSSAIPAGFAAERYDLIWTNSPFTLESPAAAPPKVDIWANYTLGSVWSYGGAKTAFLRDKKNSNKSIKVTNAKPSDEGIELVDFIMAEGSSRIAGVHLKRGQETGELHYAAAVAPGPAGGPLPGKGPGTGPPGAKQGVPPPGARPAKPTTLTPSKIPDGKVVPPANPPPANKQVDRAKRVERDD